MLSNSITGETPGKCFDIERAQKDGNNVRHVCLTIADRCSQHNSPNINNAKKNMIKRFHSQTHYTC